MYIDGKWIGEHLEQIEVTNPANGEIIASVPKGGKEEAKKAVDAAAAELTAWAAKTAAERSQLLNKWSELITEHRKEIGEIMTREQGKPLKEAIGEVDYANSFISWYAEEGKRIYGETIPASHPNKRIFVIKQPVGVVAAITPWNFPAAMITRKIAPALAAGCTVVVKPASQTPLTALKIIELAELAGFPKGVINIVTGSAKAIGDTWMADSRVRKVTFTGSTEVGKMLMRKAADTVKKISLELGGHAPFIIMEDADVDRAVNSLIESKFRNAGQTCICSNRVYIHESIIDRFSEKLVERVKKLKIGNGLDAGVDIGPLIDQDAVDKVMNHIHDAVNQGARILVGGGISEINGGTYFEPTILTNVSDSMVCMKEETFGPLAPLTAFKSEEEVLQRVNDTSFGLAAYVFTENISRAIRLSEQLEFGIVGLNDGLPSVPQAPFGGFKESGLGREGGHHGIEEFLEVKYISLGVNEE